MKVVDNPARFVLSCKKTATSVPNQGADTMCECSSSLTICSNSETDEIGCGWRLKKTRRRVLAAAMAGIAAIGSKVFRSPIEVGAYGPCRSYQATDIVYSATCRATWGPPRCDNACAFIESPNGLYFNDWCCDCLPVDCACTPLYIQARVGICNTGRCSRRCGGERGPKSVQGTDGWSPATP